MIPTLIWYCTVVSASLSLVGEIFIFSNWFAFKQLHTFAFKLILTISICNFISTISDILAITIDLPNHHPICITQAFANTFGDVGSFYWTGCIAFTIGLIMNSSNKPSQNRSSSDLLETDWDTLLIKFHVFGWILIALLACLPFSTGSYGLVSADGWCWINYSSNWNIVWTWVSYYGPAFIVLAYILFTYIRIWSSVTDLHRSKIRHITYYPLVLLVCFVIGGARRIFTSITRESGPVGWAAAHKLLFSLMGFLNAVVYGSTPSVRAAWAAKWESGFCPSRGEVAAENEEEAGIVGRDAGVTNVVADNDAEEHVGEKTDKQLLRGDGDDAL